MWRADLWEAEERREQETYRAVRAKAAQLEHRLAALARTALTGRRPDAHQQTDEGAT